MAFNHSEHTTSERLPKRIRQSQEEIRVLIYQKVTSKRWRLDHEGPYMFEQMYSSRLLFSQARQYQDNEEGIRTLDSSYGMINGQVDGYRQRGFFFFVLR